MFTFEIKPFQLDVIGGWGGGEGGVRPRGNYHPWLSVAKRCICGMGVAGAGAARGAAPPAAGTSNERMFSMSEFANGLTLMVRRSKSSGTPRPHSFHTSGVQKSPGLADLLIQ